MNPTTTARAVAAVVAVVEAAGLRADDVDVLSNSNRLTVHVEPASILARVAPRSRQRAAVFEAEVARRLAVTEAPIGHLDPRFEPRVHEHDGFAVTLWTHHEHDRSVRPSSADSAAALNRLHAAMRRTDLTDIDVPHVLDRVGEAQAFVDAAIDHPTIGPTDRDLIARALAGSRTAVVENGSTEQLLHGEPHPGNLLATVGGLRFIDLETCCLGPVEFDLAHATGDTSRPPYDLAAQYPGADETMLRHCWILSLALAVAWRCEPGDDLPDGAARARTWIAHLRDELDR